jgi:hypothetical protein
MSKEKRGFISGSRIVGDIGGLSSILDPVSGTWAQMISPAVNLTGVTQTPWDLNGSAAQNYELGSRLVVDERVFHYARAGAALVPPCQYRLQTNGDIQSANTWGMALAAPGIVAGVSSFVVTHGNYGLPAATTVALNELKGGWVEIWGAGNVFMWRRIVSNTASLAGVPATLTIVVDKPFEIAVAAGPGVVALHRNFYYNVVMGGSVPAIVGYESAVGLTPIAVGIGRYFWLQTYGPCFIASQLGNPGAVIGFRDVYLGAAGTVVSKLVAEAGGANVSPQRVGYISGASTNADGNNDVVLQLAP